MGLRRLIQLFSHSRFAKNNKWIAFPVLTLFGAGGAVWGFYAMLSQGLYTVLGRETLMNELWFYRLAICCAAACFFFGCVELTRVLGKSFIIDDAEKIRIAMYAFEQHKAPEVREISQKISSQLRGRPDKNCIGELDYILGRFRKALHDVLSDYHHLLTVKIRSETAKNPVILAWRHADPRETSTLLAN